MFSARNGRAPIAYTSESAFVAAILPQSYGSSTIGVKKSSVATSAWPSGSRTTAASSPVSAATSTSAPSSGSERVPSTVSRSAGPSLHPHPAPWLKDVSRRCSTDRGCHTAVHADRRRRAPRVDRVRPRRARAGRRRHRARDRSLGGARQAAARSSAVQLARLAGDCTFYTALGDDERGAWSRRRLAELGVRVEAATRDEPTRRGVVFVDANGERTITTLGRRLEPTTADDLPWDELEGVDAVYFTAGDAGALREARRREGAGGDEPDRGPARRGRRAPGRGRGQRRRPGRGVRSRRRSPIHPTWSFGPTGVRGGRYETSDGRSGPYEPAAPPGPVVDTYGAGDSFAAGSRSRSVAGLEIEEALSLAARCGAWCAAGRGPYGNQLAASDLRDARSRSRPPSGGVRGRPAEAAIVASPSSRFPPPAGSGRAPVRRRLRPWTSARSWPTIRRSTP